MWNQRMKWIGAHSQVAALVVLLMSICPVDGATSKPSLDTFGDPLPPGVVTRIGSNRLRMKGDVTSVTYSPDGQALASGDSQGSVCLWDGASLKKIREWHNLGGPVSSLAFSPNSKTLAVLVGRLPVQLIRTFDVNTGKQLQQFEQKIAGKELERLQRFAFNVRAVGFAGNEGTLISFTRDDKIIRRHDLAKDNDLGQLGSHEAEIRFLGVSPDGKCVVSAGLDYKVILQETSAFGVGEGRCFQIPLIPAGSLEGNIIAAAFSPDKKTVALCLPHFGLCLWDAATRKKLHHLASSPTHFNGLAFSPDGRTLAGAASGSVTLWDTATGKERFGRSSFPSHAMTLSPYGRTVAAVCGDGMVRTWDAKTAKELRSVSGKPRSREVAGLRDSSTGETIRRFIQEPWMNSLSFSPDGKYLAGASSDNTIYLWEASTLKLVRQLQGHSEVVLSASFSPNGKQLVSGSRDDTARLWDVASGKQIRSWRGHLGDPPYLGWREVLAAAFSPDGKSLIMLTHDAGAMRSSAIMVPTTEEEAYKIYRDLIGNEVRILDAESGAESPLNKSLRDRLSYTGAFCPDGKTFVSTGFDGAIRLWDLPRGKYLRLPPDPRKADKIREPWWKLGIITGMSTFDPLAFSPDGKRLAISSHWHGDVSIIEVATGNVTHVLTAHSGGIGSLAFSSDGRFLASQASDSTILVWDMAALNEYLK